MRAFFVDLKPREIRAVVLPSTLSDIANGNALSLLAG